MSNAIAILMAMILGIVSLGAMRGGSPDAETAVISAQSAGPSPAAEATGLVLVEHADHVTTVDLGEPGPSAGDMIVWGPDPLYDEADTADTGATTQGFCVWIDASSQCVLTETIVFADDSTLNLQGVQAAGAGPSTRIIVGGSGQYLGASGTVQVQPSEDLTRWVKTFDITM